MAATDTTFIFIATYPDEDAARGDYQVVKDLHSRGLVGSYDAAVVTKDASGKIHENTAAGHQRDVTGLARGDERGRTGRGS